MIDQAKILQSIKHQLKAQSIDQAIIYPSYISHSDEARQRPLFIIDVKYFFYQIMMN